VLTTSTLSRLQRFRGNSQASNPITTVGNPIPTPTPIAILSEGLNVKGDPAVSDGTKGSEVDGSDASVEFVVAVTVWL